MESDPKPPATTVAEVIELEYAKPTTIQNPTSLLNSTNLPQRRTNEALANALSSQGITRKGLISELYDIAINGQRVKTTIKKGVEVQKEITEDPSIKLQAIDKLSKMLDRAEGTGTMKRSLKYEEEY